MKSWLIIAVAGILLTVSFAFDRQKTRMAITIAVNRLLALLPSFLTMLASVALALTLVPSEDVATYLGGENTVLSMLLGALVGSVSLMPGFIAYPLSAILINRGVAYMVISAFTTTLMMVGILTFPIERRFLGTKVAIIRNVFSFIIACVTALVTGLYFGELIG